MYDYEKEEDSLSMSGPLVLDNSIPSFAGHLAGFSE